MIQPLPFKRRAFAIAFAFLVPSVALLPLAACQTTTAARYLPKEGAPKLQPRGGGCKVYTHLAGSPLDLPQPHKIVGEVESNRSKEQMREGGEAAIRELEVAACEAGIYAVIDIKVYPGASHEGGATYIGKAAVFVDDNGKILGDRPEESDDGGTSDGKAVAE